MKIFRATVERVRQDLQALGEGRNVFGIIHRDINPWNFVFHNGAVYVSDFEECGWGYYLYDIAVTLVDLDFSQGDYGARYAPMRAAFLEGYQRVSPLPVGYQEYIGTFMAIEMVRIANMILGWKAPTEKPWGPIYLARVVERLEEFAAGNDINAAGNDINRKPIASRLLLWLKSSPLDLVGRRSW